MVVVPGRVLVDTSFVVEALIVSQPVHESCLDFLVRLAEAETELVFSRLLELELAETAYQLALKERHPRDWKRFRADGRARRRATRLLGSVRAAWSEVLENVPSVCVEVEDVAEAVPTLMSRYGLASYDAVHVATAIHANVGAIATLDAGFAAVPASVAGLYVDASRVAFCRRRRRR